MTKHLKIFKTNKSRNELAQNESLAILATQGNDGTTASEAYVLGLNTLSKDTDFTEVKISKIKDLPVLNWYSGSTINLINNIDNYVNEMKSMLTNEFDNIGFDSENWHSSAEFKKEGLDSIKNLYNHHAQGYMFEVTSKAPQVKIDECKTRTEALGAMLDEYDAIQTEISDLF